MEAGVTPEYDPRPVNEPIPDPIKATGTRGVARRTLLTQVRKDIRKLAADIPPLPDNEQAEDEWVRTMRVLLSRYDELTKPE